MLNRLTWRGLSFFLTLMVLGAPAKAVPEIVVFDGSATEVRVDADGGATHVASSYKFPLKLGDMPLREVMVHRPRDVSAYYTLRGGGNGDSFITVFLYPVEQGIDAEVADTRAAMFDNLTDREPLSVSISPAGTVDGTSEWARGKMGSIEVMTGFYLVQRDGWFLKVRATIPTSGPQVNVDRTKTALDDINWAGPPISAGTRRTKVGATN